MFIQKEIRFWALLCAVLGCVGVHVSNNLKNNNKSFFRRRISLKNSSKGDRIKWNRKKIVIEIRSFSTDWRFSFVCIYILFQTTLFFSRSHQFFLKSDRPKSKRKIIIMHIVYTLYRAPTTPTRGERERNTKSLSVYEDCWCVFFAYSTWSNLFSSFYWLQFFFHRVICFVMWTNMVHDTQQKHTHYEEKIE